MKDYSFYSERRCGYPQRYMVNKHGKLVKDVSNSEDVYLTTQVDDFKAELTKLQEEYTILDQDYQTEVRKLGVLKIT